MTERIRRYRVAADFTEMERNAIDALCEADYRQPSELLRWLVVQEARKRGILSDSPPPAPLDAPATIPESQSFSGTQEVDP